MATFHDRLPFHGFLMFQVHHLEYWPLGHVEESTCSHMKPIC